MIIKWILLGLLAIFVVGFVMSLINIYLEKMYWKLGKKYILIVILLAVIGCFYFMYYSEDREIDLKPGVIFVVIEFICYYFQKAFHGQQRSVFQ